MFIGGTISVEQPLGENEHGYKASQMVDLSLTAFSGKVKLINASVGASLMLRHTTEGYWKGENGDYVIAPNSKSTLLIHGVGFLWNLKFATLAVNLQKPIFYEGSLTGTVDQTETTKVYQISVSMRKILNYSKSQVDCTFLIRLQKWLPECKGDPLFLIDFIYL